MTKAAYAQALEALVGAFSVVCGLLVLGLLEDTNMPMIGKLVSFTHLQDIKFYAPPLAAIAIGMFNTPSLPALRNLIVAILLSTVGSVGLLQLVGRDPIIGTRALACGFSMLLMKLTGCVFPPAGALAVLFLDNMQMQKDLGIFYFLMPGLSGTAVLILLAVLKIGLLNLLKPVFKSIDPEGELTAPLMPKPSVSAGPFSSPTYPQALEALIAACSVVLGVIALGMLEETPMPWIGNLMTFAHLQDVKFYAPPLGAVAIVVFNASSLPALRNIVVAIVCSTAGACVLLKVVGRDPLLVTRALACGFSMLIMKLTGCVFPAAAALTAMLMDNMKVHSELGIFFCLMPGLTGTAVLVLMAAVKIEFHNAINSIFAEMAKKKKEVDDAYKAAANLQVTEELMPQKTGGSEQRGRPTTQEAGKRRRNATPTPGDIQRKTNSFIEEVAKESTAIGSPAGSPSGPHDD